MNCEHSDMLMADALGNELSPSDRSAFEDHLAECERCRHEYETARAAVETMRALPGPPRVIVRREGDRLVIESKRGADLGPGGVPRRLKPAARMVGVVFRYAASVLVAFATGYALHAGMAGRADSVVQDHGAPVSNRYHVPAGAASGDSLQAALLSAHAGNPARSNLAKCLIAISHGQR